MFKAFFWGGREYRTRAFGGVAVLVLVLICQVWIAVVYNGWNGTFFESLEHATERPTSDLWAGLLLLGLIAVGDIAFGTIAGIFAAFFTIWWRKALTEHYIPRWKKCTARIEGASQRIQEDPGELASIVEGIGLDLCRSVFTVFAFLPMLWMLGRHVQIGPITWAGTLAVIAFTMSLLSIVISWFVGKFLPKLEYDHQKAEAAFRKQLVFAEEQRVRLETGHGWEAIFIEVLDNARRLIRHYAYFNIWSAGYEKYMMLLPFALCIPSMSSGAVTLALFMQINHAFGQVQGGFSFVMKNWTRVTKFRSVYRRLWEFERALEHTHPDPTVVAFPLSEEIEESALSPQVARQ